MALIKKWNSLHQLRWAYWLPLIAYSIFIFYLSSLSEPVAKFPVFGNFNDKVFHMLEFGILGVLFYRVFRWALNAWSASRACLLAILAASLFALSDEFHQSFVPNRSSDIFDVLADFAGATIMVSIWHGINLSKYEGRIKS